MRDDNLKKFGANVRYYRKKNNLTQEKLAELLDFSVNYVGMIERGERNSSLLTVYHIADTLNIPPKSLFEEIKML